jgi:tetratricopeptide (TPR) repeat protein
MANLKHSAAMTIAVALSAILVVGCGGAQARKAKHLERGQAYLRAGSFEKARVEFQNALQIAPTDPEARFEMAVAAGKLGDVRQAAQFYQATLDVKPDHAGARRELARISLLSGNPDKALELLKPALDKTPDDSELLSIRAAAHAQQKDIPDAQADAERAVQLDPGNEDAVAVLAGIYTAQGDQAKAAELLEAAIHRIPDTVDLRFVLAQLYAQQSRPADVEALLLKIIALKPQDKANRLRLAQFYAQTNQIDAAENTLREAIAQLPKEGTLKFALVDFLAARRSRELAESELKKMIGADPKDVELKFALARFYETGQQPAKAEAVYQDLIKQQGLEPTGLRARDHLAALLAQRNDIAGALALSNEVLDKSPRDDDALALRGNIALQNQDPRSAIADLRAVLRDQPNASGVLRALARAHIANGEPAIAEETIRHAVEANPKDLSLQLDFAQLLAQLGKPEQAKPILAAIVKDQPNDVQALDAQFRVAMATHDVVTATAAADAIVGIRPKSGLGHLYEGLIAESANNPDKALEQYGIALTLEPNAEEPLEAEALLLMHQKRSGEALKRLDAIISSQEKNAFAAKLKGDVLASMGQQAAARAAYEVAITRSPKWWRPYHGVAATQIADKNVDAAIATLRRGLGVAEPADALGTELAALLETQGKSDESIAEYEEVLARYPHSDTAANNLSMMLVEHRTDRASLDRAKALASRFSQSPNVSFLDTYGWVLFKDGDAAASVPVLQRVVDKVPNEPLARYHLGMAQSGVGSNSEARDNLSMAVNSGKQFPGLEEARATLDRLAKAPGTSPAAPKT